MGLSVHRNGVAALAALLSAVVLDLWTPVVGQTSSSASADPGSLKPLLPVIDAHFRRVQQGAHIPGLVYGIVRGGELLHVGAIGVQDLESHRPVDADSLFRIASMSKAFTALAILKLRDEGRLRLDELGEVYVPQMRAWRYPTTDAPRIRVRDLLSHVGGFVTDDPWGDRQQVLPEPMFTKMLLDGVPFTRTPGTAYEYSNFGFALLGRIVTNVSGRPYGNYIQQEIMQPLRMHSTGYEIREFPRERRALGYRWENEAFAREPDMEHGAFGAMGGVQTSANDYARWVAFLLSAWPARDEPEQGPVRRSSVRELAQGLNFPELGRRPGSSSNACPQARAYGMGMRVAIDCDVGVALIHGGGYPGYGSFVLLLPEHGVGFFAFSNRTYAGVGGAVWNSVMELQRAGWLSGRTIPTSAALANAYRAVGAMYEAGEVGPGRAVLAMNFLMDRTEANWQQEFFRLKGETGACRTGAPITPTGALTGRFTWTCERGNLEGNLLLAPTRPPTIQALQLSIAPPR